MLRSSSSFSRHTGLERMRLAQLPGPSRRCADPATPGAPPGRAGPRAGTPPESRFCSMTRIPTSWRRRSSRASSSRVVSSGSGRGSGRTPRPKATRTVGVDAVGLGQPAGGLGEVAGLAGVDHGGRQAGDGQGRRGQLQAAGGLEDDQARGRVAGVGRPGRRCRPGRWRGGPSWPPGLVAVSRWALEISMPTKVGVVLMVLRPGAGSRLFPSLLCGLEAR